MSLDKDFDEVIDRHNWIDSFCRLSTNTQDAFFIFTAFIVFVVCGFGTCAYHYEPDGSPEQKVSYDCSSANKSELNKYMKQCKENYQDWHHGRLTCENRYPRMMCKPIVKKTTQPLAQ